MSWASGGSDVYNSSFKLGPSSQVTSTYLLPDGLTNHPMSIAKFTPNQILADKILVSILASFVKRSPLSSHSHVMKVSTHLFSEVLYLKLLPDLVCLILDSACKTDMAFSLSFRSVALNF